MSDYIKNLLDEDVEGKKTAKAEGDEHEMHLDEEAELARMAMAFEAIDGEDNLNEAMNIVRLNKQTKLNSLTSRMALVIARAKKDPLYQKYSRLNGARLSIRELIFKKYGAVALSRSRKLMAGVSNAVGKKK